MRHTAEVDIWTWIFRVGAALVVLGGITGYVLQYRDGDRRPTVSSTVVQSRSSRL